MSKYDVDKVLGEGTNKISKNMEKNFGNYWACSKLAGGWSMPKDFRKAFDGRSNKIFGR